MEDDQKERNKPVKTTIYLPRHLYESAKLMAIFTRSNVSRLVCSSLIERLKQLKEREMK